MPFKDKIPQTNWWQKLIGIFAGIGVIVGGFEGVVYLKKNFSAYFHEQVNEAVKAKVGEFEQWSKDTDKRIKDIEVKSSETFAIGLRGNDKGELYYRSVEGKIYRAYKDQEYSQAYSYDYFFYIDENGKKNWCY
jgi:hypothetical protein